MLLPLDRDGSVLDAIPSPRWRAEADLEMADDRLDDRAGRISTPPALAGKKGAGCPGLWSLPRRPEHQNPRRRRCAGKSGAPDRLARTAQRHRLRARIGRRLRCRRHHRFRTKPTTPITSATGSRKPAASPSFRPRGPARSSVPVTPSSTRSATSSKRFFNKLKHFRRVATPDTTSSSPTPWRLRQTRRYRYLAQIAKLSLRPNGGLALEAVTKRSAISVEVLRMAIFREPYPRGHVGQRILRGCPAYLTPCRNPLSCTSTGQVGGGRSGPQVERCSHF